MIYKITKENRTTEKVLQALKEHPQIKFISLIGVDLGNNHTDERIPVSAVIDDMSNFLEKGVQTDGSSVVLPVIAEINNAKVDLIPDNEVDWFIDYNHDFIDEKTNLPVGTLLIPSILIHDGKYCGSRSILKSAVKNFKHTLLREIKNNPELIKELDIKPDDIKEIVLTTATELEFWVKSPDSRAEEKLLSTSEILKEQYWKRTVGKVRTAMEEALLLLEKFDLQPEMAHKEVGGVPSKLEGSNHFSHILEQLEIDWKYSNAVQAADNELIVRHIIKDCFVRYGLEVIFKAKPMENVAGSGEHHHIGAVLLLKSGKAVNLFAPKKFEKYFLNKIGYGSLMGILKHYDLINPFITASNDAFNRLKPGFEAPIVPVASLGHSPSIPSRNRTVLIGLIRDMENPLATRFELRSPSPLSNTYLCLASTYQCMIDGIHAVLHSEHDLSYLEKAFDKGYNEEVFYLNRDRVYRSEEDVFERFTDEERDTIFGKPPMTVWENISSLKDNPSINILKDNDVFTDRILESYIEGVKSNWTFELENRILLQNRDIIRNAKKLHDEDAVDLDIMKWKTINDLRYKLMKSNFKNKSLFALISDNIAKGNFDEVSRIQIEMQDKISSLKKLYEEYKENLLNL